jgi:hypothetical protein
MLEPMSGHEPGRTTFFLMSCRSSWASTRVVAGASFSIPVGPDDSLGCFSSTLGGSQGERR